MTLDEIRRPAVAAKELLELFAANAGEQGGIGNLVAVQMQNRQHGSVGGGIQKLVGMPGGGKRSGFRLAVANDAGDDEIGIVERRAERMAQRIAELAAFVDRARALRRHVAGMPPGNENCLKSFRSPASSWLTSG